MAASNEIVHCILWKRRCVVLCVCVFVCDPLMLCVCAVIMHASLMCPYKSSYLVSRLTLCPEQQAKIGWSRRGKAVVSKCLERKGMSGIFFCQGCGASGDLAKIQKHQQSSARKSSIRNFHVVRSQYPKLHRYCISKCSCINL